MLTALEHSNYFNNFNALIELANSSKSADLTLWILRTFLIICHTISEAKGVLFNSLCKFNCSEFSKEGINELFESFSVFLFESDNLFIKFLFHQLSKYKKIKERWSFDSCIHYSSFELSDTISDHLAIISSLKSKISFVGNSLKHFSSSPRHNSCISVARANMNFVAIGAQNADVKVWDIKKSIFHNNNNNNSLSLIDLKEHTSDKNNEYFNQHQNSKLLNGHSSPIVDISIDESMDAIISIDESQLLICFSISTGNQIFSMQLTTNVKRIFLSKLGFIIVISEIDHKNNSPNSSRRSSSISTSNNENNIDEYSSNQLEMENITSISLFDLSGRLIEMSDFSGTISCAELIETIDYSEFLACSFENCIFMLLRIYDLFEVLRSKTFSRICLMTFSKKKYVFLV